MCNQLFVKGDIVGDTFVRLPRGVKDFIFFLIQLFNCVMMTALRSGAKNLSIHRVQNWEYYHRAHCSIWISGGFTRESFEVGLPVVPKTLEIASK